MTSSIKGWFRRSINSSPLLIMFLPGLDQRYSNGKGCGGNTIFAGLVYQALHQMLRRLPYAHLLLVPEQPF